MGRAFGFRLFVDFGLLSGLDKDSFCFLFEIILADTAPFGEFCPQVDGLKRWLRTLRSGQFGPFSASIYRKPFYSLIFQFQ